MPEVDVPSRTWTVTRRRDRTGLVYLRDGNDLWWCPQFTRRWPLGELDAEYGPTTPFDVDDVEALLADHARLIAEVERLRTVADITDAATEGGAATHVPHIKVRIGNWYTRKIGRWT